MSQVKPTTRALAIGCALLAVIVVGCSKKNGTPFDPDAGHPADFLPAHPTEYRNALGACGPCHGTDLLGGISTVSCYSASRDGQSCHPGGPGGHPAGWRALHSADPSRAATCAPCHDNKENNLAPNCFDNSLCHGPKEGHPSGWLAAHSRTNPSQASYCADCHRSNAGTPGCFNNTLCHGSDGGHPAGWSARDQHGAAAKASGGFASCQSCHGSDFGGASGASCLNAACHGWGAPHASSGWSGGGSRHRSTNIGNVAVCARCHPVAAPTSGTTCNHNGSCHED